MKAVHVGRNGQHRGSPWPGWVLVWALMQILMSGPVPSVDSGFSRAPHGPHRRSEAALGPHLPTRSLDLPTFYLVNASVCWGDRSPYGPWIQQGTTFLFFFFFKKKTLFIY